MLCVRSASFTRITRRSRTIASSILRKLSACASSRLLNLIWSSLVTPSTSSATSAPNRAASWSFGVGVSSMTSCRIAAMIVSASRCRSARIAAAATRMGDVGLAREALLALVGRSAELGGFADALDLLGRQVGLDAAQQLFEARSAPAAGKQSQERRRVVHGAQRRGQARRYSCRQSPRPNCGARNSGLSCPSSGIGASGGGGSGSRSISARDVACGDLAQGDHGGLVVLPGHRGLGAIGEPARALGSQQHELEQVFDVVQAVFDGDTGHGCAQVSEGARDRGRKGPKL